MAVYGGDVGLDEFAKHPNAKLLWQTAQARVTWACDVAVWSSHDGEDTLFNEFAQQARATCGAHDSARASSFASLQNPADGSPLPSDGTTVREAVSNVGESNLWRRWERTGIKGEGS